MKPGLVIAALAAPALTLACATAHAADLEKHFKSLAEATPSTVRSALVDNITIVRGDVEITFERGRLIPVGSVLRRFVS